MVQGNVLYKLQMITVFLSCPWKDISQHQKKLHEPLLIIIISSPVDEPSTVSDLFYLEN